MTLAAANKDSATKKEFLKVNGGIWGAAAALSAYNASKGHQKEKNTWTIAAAQAGMAGVMLWRGLAKDKSV